VAALVALGYKPQEASPSCWSPRRHTFRGR
ncbi:hypothetical protein FK521_29475, partial [Klebsiella pneumoniae]|nr:hypothetical protein [Klebsiella pneumoniae]